MRISLAHLALEVRAKAIANNHEILECVIRNKASLTLCSDTFCGVFVASILEGLGEDQAILRAIEMAERTCMSARSVGDC